MDITFETLPDGAVRFWVEGQSTVFNIKDYTSGAAMKEEVLRWAKVHGGTNPVGF